MNRTYEEVSVFVDALSGLKRKGWQLHSDDGPSYISYYSDGSILFESWSRDGKTHRDDGPAIAYYTEGEVFPPVTSPLIERTWDLLEWYKNGKVVESLT